MARIEAGVYKFSSSAQLTGTLTLSGNGVYIFKIGSTLTTASKSVVALTDGAEGCSVFWQVRQLGHTRHDITAAGQPDGAHEHHHDHRRHDYGADGRWLAVAH